MNRWYTLWLELAVRIIHYNKALLWKSKYHGDAKSLNKNLGFKKASINNIKYLYTYLNVDKSEDKWGSGDQLEKFEIKKLPIYIQKNLNNFKEWID